MTKFQDKYRVESARLPGWDYASSAWYFVTICTRDRIEFFGQVIDGRMVLSDLGQIALEFWQEIPQHHVGVTIDDSVIMPNHGHGIIVINSPAEVETLQSDIIPVETLHATSLRRPRNMDDPFSAMSPKAGSVSAVVRSYKAAVTNWARKNGRPDFAWQSRYYDHIIRDNRSLARIRQYIRDNPLKWEVDRNNPENLLM